MKQPARRHIILVESSGAGRHKPECCAELARALGELGCQADVLKSEGKGSSSGDQVRRAARLGADAAVIVGGDGTIRHAAEAALDIGLPLGVYPAGIINLLARELGLPLRASPDWWARLYFSGGLQTIFPGYADFADGSRGLFMDVASVGPDSLAVAGVDLRLKRVIGRGAYAVSALRHLLSPTATLSLQGNRRSLTSAWVLVARGRYYAGRYRMREKPLHDKWVLGISALNGGSGALRGALAIFRNRMDASAHWAQWESDHLALSAPLPMPVQLDGDIAGMTPVTLSLSDRPVHIIAKPTAEMPG